jgi:aspartate/methionine/tyrosine aminotransferase
MFSSRSAFPQEQNPLTLTLNALRSRGVPILDLTLSNPTRAGIAYDSDGILAALGNPAVLSYEPLPFGPLLARQAISQALRASSLGVPADRIVVTASSSESYSYLFKLLCDPGDEVLVPAPSYPLFEHLARFDAVTPVAYPIAFDGAWFIDFARLQSRIGARTRAVVVVSPNNPTGNYLTRPELAQLAELGLPVISDEVFAPYELARPANAARSALECADVPVFALSGLSKLAALPQMKIGWIAMNGPPAAVATALARLELIGDAYLSPSAPSLAALPELLRLGQVSSADIVERMRENAKTLAAVAAGASFSALPVQGGWSAVLRLPRIQSEERWVLGLLGEENVLTQPGYFYDFEDEPYAVVSLLTPPERFRDGLERIARHVARH